MGDDHQSLLKEEQEGIHDKKSINQLYLNANYLSKLFGCWAGTYSRWVNN